MEELAKKLLDEINKLCIEFHYIKKNDIIKSAVALRADIESLSRGLLAALGTDKESEQLRAYTLQVLNDYVEAASQRDEVLMIDTLDYGLREIVGLYIDEEDNADNEQ